MYRNDIWYLVHLLHGEVHGANDEEREGVYADHNEQERNVQQHLDETCQREEGISNSKGGCYVTREAATYKQWQPKKRISNIQKKSI